ncbi:RDD family protein [Spelaeicoccus albus]|uniref:Putative RDD family membrane protein YckC n=1 Tax=Spelaeicoccus albus TaxID=1280376 RepID=A0A7Z0AAE7_9MICO|nr:RDD family protein [Spelaeicoccus albus]NYI66543.1 putative RDD family membrane protein YckC [Spelaeicoccus albus]
MRSGRRRLLAWLIDWACILGWVAITAAVGVPLYLAGVIAPDGVLALNLVAAFVMVIPVVFAAAICESGSSAATPGKRALRLIVISEVGPPRFRAALARNMLKLGVPWLLGHAAVYAITSTSSESATVPVGVWILTAAAYLIPSVWVVCLFAPGGRTPYDLITRTTVVLAPSPRRVVDG